jgi:hypothetical protein
MGLRASGTLKANTNPGSPENPPADFCYNLALDQEFLLFYTRNGTTYNFTISATDPADSTIWIDSSAFASATDPATAVSAAINALGISGISADNAGGTSQTCTVSDTNTGAAESHSGSIANAADPATITGGGSGWDAIAPSGATTEVVLAAGVDGKKIKQVQLSGNGSIGGGVSFAFYLRSPGDVDTQLTSPLGANTQSVAIPFTDAPEAWLNGLDAGESLVAKITPGSLGYLPADSSTCLAQAIFEQS